MNELLENSTALNIETQETIENLKSFLEESSDNILLKFKHRFIAVSRNYLLEHVDFCGIVMSILGVINLYKSNYESFKDLNNNIFEIFGERIVLFNVYSLKVYKRIPSNYECAVRIYQGILKHTNLLKPPSIRFEDVDLTVGLC
jgi:hypothetical protein